MFIEDPNVRQQRAGLFLRDVKYRLFAEFEFIPPDQRSKVYNPVPEYLVDAEEVDRYSGSRTFGLMKQRPSMPPCLNGGRGRASASTSPISVAVNFLPASIW